MNSRPETQAGEPPQIACCEHGRRQPARKGKIAGIPMHRVNLFVPKDLYESFETKAGAIGLSVAEATRMVYREFCGKTETKFSERTIKCAAEILSHGDPVRYQACARPDAPIRYADERRLKDDFNSMVVCGKLDVDDFDDFVLGSLFKEMKMAARSYLRLSGVWGEDVLQRLDKWISDYWQGETVLEIIAAVSPKAWKHFKKDAPVGHYLDKTKRYAKAAVDFPSRGPLLKDADGRPVSVRSCEDCESAEFSDEAVCCAARILSDGSPDQFREYLDSGAKAPIEYANQFAITVTDFSLAGEYFEDRLLWHMREHMYRIVMNKLCMVEDNEDHLDSLSSDVRDWVFKKWHGQSVYEVIQEIVGLDVCRWIVKEEFGIDFTGIQLGNPSTVKGCSETGNNE